MRIRRTTALLTCVLVGLPLGAVHAQRGATSDNARVTTARVSNPRTVAGAALVAAAARGDWAAVQSLIAQGADVNVAQGDGMTALHWAADGGNAAMATALLKAGANLTATTRIGDYTPLHVASRAGSAAVVRALLAAGADARKQTGTGATALHFAAAAGSGEAVKALIAAKADPNVREVAWGQTPLMFAAAANRPDAVTALLKAGADPNLRTTSLDLTKERARQQSAVRARNEALFGMLTETERDSIRKSMAKAAAENPQRSRFPGAAASAAPAVAARAGAARAGAAQSATPKDSGKAPAAPAFRIGNTTPPIGSLTPTQIQEAILAGREAFDAPTNALAPAAADQSEQLEGNVAGYEGTVGSLGGLTALLHAARQGNAEAALAMLDGGADINEPSATDSITPLLMAAINGHFDLAMQLINRGANVKLASTAGLTPLYAALNTFWAPRSRYPQPQSVQNQKVTHLALVSAMIQAGADVNVRLKKNLWFFAYSNCGNANCGLEMLDGTSPFWRAAYAVDVDAMRMLKSAGADDTMPSFREPTAGGRGGRGGGGGGGGGGGAPGAAAAAGSPPGALGAAFGPAVLPMMVGVDAATDSAAKAAVPGIGTYPIHSVAGVGYGNGFAGNAHRHAPDGWMPALKYLVEELGHDVNKRDQTGYTPLHHAAARGDNEMILYLVSKGADVKAVARNGRTTVDMANGPVQRLRPFPETIQLLEKLGAKNSHRCVSC